jgi:hypothetical protein
MPPGNHDHAEPAARLGGGTTYWGESRFSSCSMLDLARSRVGRSTASSPNPSAYLIGVYEARAGAKLVGSLLRPCRVETPTAARHREGFHPPAQRGTGGCSPTILFSAVRSVPPRRIAPPQETRRLPPACLQTATPPLWRHLYAENRPSPRYGRQLIHLAVVGMYLGVGLVPPPGISPESHDESPTVRQCDRRT